MGLGEDVVRQAARTPRSYAAKVRTLATIYALLTIVSLVNAPASCSASSKTVVPLA